jgi:hypothetical protein
MTTEPSTPRVLYQPGPDHQELLEWAETHTRPLRSAFIKWLLSSRLQVATPEDDPAKTVGKYTGIRLYCEHLTKTGAFSGGTPEAALARRFTRRLLCHLLKGIRFTRKPGTHPES